MTFAASAITCGRTLADLLYPPACLLCRTHLNTSARLCEAEASRRRSRASPVCQTCEAAMPRLSLPVCARCGVGLPGPYDAQFVCASCQRHPPAFEQACAPLVYAQAAREAIHAFKYQGRHRLGSWLAAQMAACARRRVPLAEIHAVVPVPLHWLKRRLRRLDPPVALARALARTLGILYVPLLRRVRWTTTQIRLSSSERVRNVEGAFQVRANHRVNGGILLVDDVLTSGATANACAQPLHDAGLQPIYVLTAARTPIHP